MKANRAFRTSGGFGPGTIVPPSVQQALLQDLSISQLRSLAPLPDEAQRVIDSAVVRVGRDRLTLVNDLLSEGLVYNLSDPLSVTEVYWESLAEVGGATRAMNPQARGENQLEDRRGYRLPVFITMDDFNMGVRLLRASQRAGQPLDTSMIEQATRRVNEGIEDQAINGIPGLFGGHPVYGLLNAPGAQHVAYGSNESWTAAGHDGEDILADVESLIAAAHAAKRFGPYNLYVNTAYGIKLSTHDFKANSDKTIWSRLEEIQVGGRNLRIRVADMMPPDRVALVQMTSDVIDVVNGQAPIAVPWTSADGFMFHWLVMAIVITRVKQDYENNSGIVLGNTTLP